MSIRRASRRGHVGRLREEGREGRRERRKKGRRGSNEEGEGMKYGQGCAVP